jgi:serine/threonine-protein kinase HipA
VDADDNADELVRKHAVRIAHYLYPKAYLSAASAVLLGPTSDGRLYLSGRRNQRTRLRALEIIQNEAPPHPSIGDAVVNDGQGEFRIPVSSIRQRFLEAFRLRSEHAASIDPALRAAIAARLVEEYGSPSGAADASWALARENQWYREGEAAERYLLQRPMSATPKNAAALELIVAWHGTPIGHLTHDGFEWRWKPTDFAGPPLIRQTTAGRLPPFIVSLLPEGWLEEVLNDAKHDATMERVARAVRPLSTDAKSDMLTVVRRAVFAWLIADGDMHLKNMALLKIAQPGNPDFHSVGMAPLYDAVTTRVFPNLKHDRMAWQG